MTVVDSTGHCKWFENKRWWGCFLSYSIYIGFTPATKNGNQERIFNNIKRNKNLSVTS